MELKEIVWAGSSLKDLKTFPEAVVSGFGYSLFRLQSGLLPDRSYKPMTSIETGVYELREQDARGWYRVIYYTRIEGKIIVLHAFEKKTTKTPQADIDLAVKRLKEEKRKRGR
jgi:phage-related protein